MLNAAGEGIMGLDREGRIRFINAAAAKLLGYPQDELEGQSSHDALHHCRESGDPLHPRDCPIMQTLHQGVEHWVDTESFTRQDGTVFPCQYASAPIQENGQITGAVVSFLNITDRRQLEEKLRRTTRALRVLSDCNRVLVTAQKEGEFLQEICRLIVQENGYILAWIGFPQADAAKTVLPVAFA
ncbi:MAG: PAS domain S-box protein, partial [Deltaproteobacteria bacterium]|nr:PAS domain S-box protein [Deltaproteobacteria bacterium]